VEKDPEGGYSSRRVLHIPEKYCLQLHCWMDRNIQTLLQHCSKEVISGNRCVAQDQVCDKTEHYAPPELILCIRRMTGRSRRTALQGTHQPPRVSYQVRGERISLAIAEGSFILSYSESDQHFFHTLGLVSGSLSHQHRTCM